MKTPNTHIVVLAAFLSAACGGSTQKIAEPARPGSPGGYGRERAHSFGESDRGRAARRPARAQSAPPPAPAAAADESAGWSRSEARSEARRAPAEGAGELVPETDRPGLGTEWGERVSSRIREVPFTRERYGSPNGLVSFYYNDEDGVRAMLGHGYGRGYYSYVHDEARIGSGPVTVFITDDDGDPLPAVRSGGRVHVIGEAGDRYQIRVENDSPSRIEVVATVDGLDVIDGGDGDVQKRGYLVDAWGSLTIEGFRDSADSVAAFRFGSVRDSYAAERGKPRNVGVVGVALFREQGSDWRWTDEEIRRRETADPFPGRFAPPPYH